MILFNRALSDFKNQKKSLQHIVAMVDTWLEYNL